MNLPKPTIPFVCIAFVVTCVTSLQTEGPPRITLPVENRWGTQQEYIRPGSPTTIPCTAEGNPRPQYKWVVLDKETKEFKPLPSSNGLIVDADEGFLNVTRKYRETNDGTYACVAYNKYGSAMTPPISLVAAVSTPFPGSADTVPENKTAYISSELRLTCNGADSLISKPKLKIMWSRGTTLDMASLLTEKDNIVVDPKGDLHFLWVKEEDFGFYYVCSSVNRELGTSNRNTHSYQLVKASGEVTQRLPKSVYSDDVTAMAGNNATLTCLFSYYSPEAEPITITWSHGGKTVGSGRVLIVPVEAPTNQTGVSKLYTCIAEIGGSKTRADVTLTVTSPPVFRPGQTLDYVTVLQGENVVLRCGATSVGTEQNLPVWFVNTTKLGEDDGRFQLSSDRTTVTINDAKMDDERCFQCYVANRYGLAFTSGCLTVIDRIQVIEPPLSDYRLNPGTRFIVRTVATTDFRYKDQLRFDWLLYSSSNDTRGIIHLPKPPYFNVTGSELTIMAPRVNDSDWFQKSHGVGQRYKEIRLAVNISTAFEFKLIEFTVFVATDNNDLGGAVNRSDDKDSTGYTDGPRNGDASPNTSNTATNSKGSCSYWTLITLALTIARLGTQSRLTEMI